MFKVINTISSVESHPVVYFGSIIMVPIGKGITHLATDGDGEVFGFRSEPIYSRDSSEIWTTDDTHHASFGSVYLTTIKYEGDWKDSLLTIESHDLLLLG